VKGVKGMKGCIGVPKNEEKSEEFIFSEIPSQERVFGDPLTLQPFTHYIRLFLHPLHMALAPQMIIPADLSEGRTALTGHQL